MLAYSRFLFNTLPSASGRAGPGICAQHRDGQLESRQTQLAIIILVAVPLDWSARLPNFSQYVKPGYVTRSLLRQSLNLPGTRIHWQAGQCQCTFIYWSRDVI